MRKKSTLNRHKKKLQKRKRKTICEKLTITEEQFTFLIPSAGSTQRGQKRRFVTPLKSPLKSPMSKSYKSPLYRPSPRRKKSKLNSTRALFINDQSSGANGNDEWLTCQITGASADTEKSAPDTDKCEPACTPQTQSCVDDSEHTDVPRGNENVSTETNATEIDRDAATAELIKLVPDVMHNLSAEGLDILMLKFFRQIKENRFPMNNIAFRLWTEVVAWYDCKSTLRMRYSEETKMFWKLGWRIFGGRFVNFMGGYKNHGETVLGVAKRSQYSPETSVINFVVPDKKVLRSFNRYNIEGERKPGIYSDIIETISENLTHKSACLTFDGKKLKQGLTESSGDVDLLGLEPGVTLMQKQNKLQEQMDEVDGLCNQLISHDEFDSDIKLLPAIDKDNIRNVLMKSLKQVSESIHSARELKRKKEYCKGKLIERSGQSDWRKGRYVYAISAIIAFVYDIDEFLKVAVAIIEMICKYVSHVNEAKYIVGETVNLQESQEFVEIEQNDNTDMSIDDKSTRLVKQRSAEWFEIRQKAKVTGSTLYRAVGCDGINKMKDHFEKVVCGVPEKDPSPEAKSNMQHGTDNEVNAIATAVGKVIPVIEPNLLFCEEGCDEIKTDQASTFMVVSPDGSLRKTPSMESTLVAVELKCPVNGIHTSFPPRYVLQCLSEIEVLNVDSLVYITWTKNESSVFRQRKNTHVFDKAMRIASGIYGNENRKKPTKLSDEQKSLKEEIVKASKEVEFIGNFTSITSGTGINVYDTSSVTTKDVTELLGAINDVAVQCFELNRERASEAVVFLAADLDRSWEKEKMKCAPVAWFPKGYSLQTETLRDISEEVHTQCHNLGLHIPCSSFDGQWHGLVVRSIDGLPLTTFQLQKNVWKEAEKMKKTSIISELKTINKCPKWEYVMENNGDTDRRIVKASNGGERLPKLKHAPIQNRKTMTKEQPTLADVIPDSVVVGIDVSKNVLATATIDEDIEKEAFASNINEDEWAHELEELVNTCDNADVQIRGNIHDESVEHELTQTTNESINTETHQIEDAPAQNLIVHQDAIHILALLRTTKNCNTKGKWDSENAVDFLEYFTSVEKLNKLRDVEIRVVVRYMKKAKCVVIKESSTKGIKVQKLAEVLKLKLPETPIRISKSKIKTVKPLSELAVNVISKSVTKHQLNVAYAEYIWPERYSEWIHKSPVGMNTTVNNADYNWFYIPEFSEKRQQFEVKCIDSTHLLTRTRRKSCKGGLDGVTNESWKKVAKSRKTMLTPIMVEEITDPMSVSMAITHFSESVEDVMRLNHDEKSADLCRDIRSWWDSEDRPGIPAKERIMLRTGLRKRLLNKYDFGTFPPATGYVYGWPAQLWEALLASMDAKVLLYALCQGGTYNVRAFSSMIGETFFSELTLNDKRGQGTVSCQEFGEFIGNTAEQVQMRLDPERTFTYCTTRSTMYRLVEDVDFPDGHDASGTSYQRPPFRSIPRNIRTDDHMFDCVERRRLPGRKREGTVSTSRNALQKGALGVRWESARRNESKMLLAKKMGLE